MAEQYLGNPTIVSKELFSRDATSFYSKNLLSYPTSKYEDAQKQMAPENPLWWMYTLILSNQNFQLPEFVQQFLVFDDKFFLRGGAVHTEMGNVFPSIVKKTDIPQPGTALTTPRADYIRIIQEESGKDPIYLRTHIDKRKFDHGERFYSFFDYAEVMSYYIDTLTKANVLFLEVLVAAMLIAFTGGAVMFDEGTQLERFFQPTGKDLCPTEDFSKAAREFYKNDGECKTVIKKEAGRMAQAMKNRGVFDPSLVIDEINQQKATLSELKFPDISDEAKTKQWLKGMYLDQADPSKTSDLSRRKCLWALLNALSYKINRMVMTRSISNWMGFDPDRASTDDQYDLEMKCSYSDLRVFMNLEDLEAGRQATGGLEIGMFASTGNSTIQNLEARGVTFFGVPYMLPGTFFIQHKKQLQIIQYLDQIDTESFKFHLVDTWIRHTMFKVVAFKNFPGFFGTMKTFQPDPTWLAKHYTWFKDAG